MRYEAIKAGDRRPHQRLLGSSSIFRDALGEPFNRRLTHPKLEGNFSL
jgi:hypothetical protein